MVASARPAAAAVSASLERALGDPLDKDNIAGFRHSVEADRAERFPRELCDAVFEWGLAEYLLPEQEGGEFRAIEDCFELARVLSRRDLTAAVAIGATVLASLPVWLRGSARQRRAAAARIREHGFLAFALSEREHGADITAGEVTARETPDGWLVDGTKWLINNAGHAHGATVAARTGDGIRALTLFSLSRPSADDGRWTPLPKIRTHGLRGSAFGGITFTGLPAADADIIGRPGQGLAILMETLQITRVLVGGFALGALDTCLHAVLAFARERTLYGRPILALDAVAVRLADAYADLLIGEALGLGACRAVQAAPDQLPLTSACAKYLVPQLAAESMDSLAVVLGARSYLAEEHWHGIFEKMRRDCAVTGLFDGSAPVNLNIIAEQLPGLASARDGADRDAELLEIFTPEPPPAAWLTEIEFELATDADGILRGVSAARRVVGAEGGTECDEALGELLRWCEAETARLDAEVAEERGRPGWPRSGAAYDLAARYSLLHAAGACAWKWLAWRGHPSAGEFLTGGTWLRLCLVRITERLGRPRDDLDASHHAALRHLEQVHDEHQFFADITRR
ncbi:acyl-CoA dehydrogenase family protein [Actinomadura roseirufa]|uniref:acyl-CoA dehydrogenase family protein n=1 Tax=Actinomadura roseirufa TaxID=2094049 RepID=UPI0013F1579F|nr:acyl-CoA dehydrogenase [Actinomadura roseirufa]